MENIRKDSQKENIRVLVSNLYDLQKLRVAAGNRLVQSFYQQLGVASGESPDDMDKAEKNMINLLKEDYKRITDMVVEKGKTIKSIIKMYSDEGSDNKLNIVRNEIDYRLIHSYMLLLESEEESTKVLDKYVKEHPLWDKFFADIKGCGTLMSAVCIAYLNPYKARHVSSFYRYCGLDTVQDEDKEGNKLFIAKETGKKVRQKYVYTYKVDGSIYRGKVIKTGEFDANGEEVITSSTGEYLNLEMVVKNGSFVYEDIESGEDYVGDVVASLHGRRMADTEMFEYTDKDGKVKLKRGITYNPIIKTKLMGVLTGCLLKAKDPTYSTVYYDYRVRMDNDKFKKNYPDGKKNMMAQRYMIKQFLRNLWTTWRQLEGLEVDEPYEVAKLGQKPHKYNQYQCNVARNF